ncbi:MULTISPECIES: CPBP family intramembrane glutamic endopeptidase [Aliivibrio]|uniref:CPBP family intramembrane metalloprotease n=1 Tax=Aliivibrio finisterrensis TaxID=511998 RepID=A0A4Q5L0G5_9GAMM|nr:MULTISPECIES: type II CAAX endopeptidase family protein [Aliivibrio]MDD9178308.1 type II CAAX endopeptidase family protein [Aliivibrio sp. A6]RYU54880.1 CPBP family intramembrane metalloprotease [Aliivibrio finisterrensis]RYU56556.1 CPBP family intramembrane metalloprotease [Aliivibrio finisterrensis]RYU61677.1 CPBP family intramembrane metalloprotease [Aliivibrio finisterrensis]RYU66506.1 CPBP family intramembrane metalloprotease [Aliivibrio finisterrensis]
MVFDFSMWIWISLALAIVLAFVQQMKASFILLGISLIGAIIEQRLNFTGLAGVIVGLVIAYKAPNLERKWKYGAYAFIFIWSIALFLHFIPGFNNAKVLDSVVSGPLSIPFTMYLNLDKPLIFFGLLLAYPALLGKKDTFNKQALMLIAVPLFALLPLAWGLGALKPEFTIPSWWWVFALNNLLLTCVAEEAFFRGFIQQELGKRFGWVLGIAVASVLFGLAHIGGGWLLVAFATLAGVGYGLAFHYSNRLWVAVGFHFLFNFLHLVFFTYPLMR